MSPPTLLALDPASPGFARDPFGAYDQVREAGGVAPVRLPNGSTAWVVVDAALAREVLRDARAFSADPRTGARPAAARVLERHMLNADGSEHLRLRAAVSERFSASAVAGLAPRVRSISRELLDGLAAGTHDLVSAYAFPFATLVIFDILGVPLADRHQLRALTATVAAPRASHPEPAALEQAWAELEAYVRALVRTARAGGLARGERRPAGLFDALARAGAEAALTDDELLATCFLLLFAGYETTMNLIASMGWLLLSGALRPDATDATKVVEECLRWASPIEGATWRYARAACRLGTSDIPSGASVLVALAAANRDPALWSEPGLVEPARTGPPHLAFGFGPHICLGARLARLEAAVAWEGLRRLAPHLHAAEPLDDVPWRASMLVRGPSRLLVELTR